MQRANYARGLRFLPKVVALTTVGLISAAIAYQATAQVNVYTDPVGFITLNIQGKGANNAYSYQGLGMTQIPALRGTVTAVGGVHQVTLNSTLTPGQFNATNTVGASTEPSFFIEFTTGTGVGITDDIVSNDAAAVYTATDDSSFANGANFKIYPHWTVGQVFGASDSAGLLGGSTSSSADNLLVWNPITQGAVQYWYKNSGAIGGTGWRAGAATSVNAANTVLYIEQGFYTLRKAAGNLSVQLVGGVKLSNTVSHIYGPNAYTYAGNVEAAGIPLGASALYSGSDSTGLHGGSTSSSADNLLIWNPTTQGAVQYWYKNSGAIGGTGWRAGAATSVDASTNQIPLAGMAQILRRSASGFDWSMPPQY